MEQSTVTRRGFLGHVAGAATATVLVASCAGEAEAADPMLHLIQQYREQLAIYDASDNLTCEEDNALALATYRPHYGRMMENPPLPTSERGALEAIRLVLEEERGCGNQPDLTIAMLAAALVDHFYRHVTLGAPDWGADFAASFLNVMEG